MTRVLWVSHFLPYPPTGGVLQRGFGLLSNLAPTCEIHLLAMNQPRLVAQTLGDRPDALTDAQRELRRYCASVETVPIPSETRRFGRYRAVLGAALRGRSYTEQWLASPQLRRSLHAAISRYRPEVAHFDTISLAPYSDLCPGNMARSLGHHNVESHMMWRRASKTQSAVARTLLQQEAYRILELERRHVGRMDLNVVCSEVDATRLRRLARAGSVHVAENGVLDAEVSPQMLCDRDVFERAGRRMLFIGRMSAYTNRDAAQFLASDIWPQIAARFADASLDIVGSSPPAAAVQLAASDSRVRVHGFLPDLTSLIAPGAIFVCPIRDGGGTKLKILDAMNRGLPIVAHPLALEGIAVTPGRHVLVAENAQDFLTAVTQLFSNPDLRMGLAQEAFRLVREQYAFESIARKLAAKFADLSGQQRVRQ